MKRQLAIGIDDFRRIREEDYYYIDKTLLIKDFLTYKKYVTLITRPRRFGKTLNMTMMREFFDISKDSKSIFKGLQIMNTGFAKQMNTIPVIYLTFKNCSGNTPEALKESLAKAIWEEYMRYARLFGDSVDREDDRYYKFYLTYDKLRKEEISDSILESSLNRLMRAAYTFYEKRPIVLIDEYDHPLIKSYEKGFYDKFSDLYTNFLGEALKGNEYLGQALLTGIQRITKESIFSELNNFLVYTPLSKQYAAYFGLQKSEVEKMLSTYNMKLTEEISSYYNGYVFGEIEIYNPWSLLSYLDEGTLKPYWRNTSTNALVRALIEDADYDFMEAFERLLIVGEVKVVVNLEASMEEHISPRTLWGMFVNTGYLTITKESTHGMSILRIPNLESKEEIRRMVASYTRLSIEKLSNLFIASITNDVNAFIKVFRNLVCEYDGIYELEDDNYYMLFLGMAASITGCYRILHYPQLGGTISGFALQSLHPDRSPSILIELRKGDDVEKLKQDALADILAGQYYTGLEGKVLCVGLAHNENTCDVAVKRVRQAEALNHDMVAPTDESAKVVESVKADEPTQVPESAKVADSTEATESIVAAVATESAEVAVVTESAKAVEVDKTVVPAVLPKIVEPTEAAASQPAVESTKTVESQPAMEAAKTITTTKPVEQAKEATPPKVEDPTIAASQVSTLKTANVVELVAPPESSPPAGQRTSTKATSPSEPPTPSKTTPAAKQALSPKTETPVAKQTPPTKAETPVAKQAPPTKAETPAAKQTTPAKVETPATKQTEPAKITDTAQPIKEESSKKTKPSKAKKIKEHAATTKQDDAKNNNSNNSVNNKKPQRNSFLNLIVTNLHIILAVIFLLGAIFFAVNNFRNNRPQIDPGTDAGYQVDVVMMEQENLHVDIAISIEQEDKHVAVVMPI